jgi:hypothetical protein
VRPALAAFILLVGDLGHAAAAPERLRFADFFVGPTYEEGVGMRPDLKLSPKVQALNGKQVEIVGYMDGLLPPDGMYFMILKEPQLTCPFHTVSFDWAGFAAVFVARPVDYLDRPIKVTGRLDVGEKIDEMGLKSFVRIYGADMTEP